MLWLFGTDFDRTKIFVVPSAVKLSTSKSVRSKVPKVSPIKEPQKISFTVGATLKTICSPLRTVNPSVYDASSLLGLCITLLIAILSCVA